MGVSGLAVLFKIGSHTMKNVAQTIANRAWRIDWQRFVRRNERIHADRWMFPGMGYQYLHLPGSPSTGSGRAVSRHERHVARQGGAGDVTQQGPR